MKNKRVIVLLALAVMVVFILIPTTVSLGKYVLLSSKLINVKVIKSDLTLRNYVYVSGENSYNGTPITARDGTSPQKALSTLSGAYEFLNSASGRGEPAAQDGTYYIILSGNLAQATVGCGETAPALFNLPVTVTAYANDAEGLTGEDAIRTDFQTALTFQGNICQYAKTVFKNITLTVAAARSYYANGYPVVFDSGLTTDAGGGLITVYGGQTGAVVANTSITVKSGKFAAVYGGGETSGVSGSVQISIENAEITGNVYGAGKAGGSGGNVTVGLNGATASSVYGGSQTSGNVSGNININLSGNTYITGSLYGGSASTGTVSGTTTVNADGAEIGGDIYGGGAGTGAGGAVILNIANTTAKNIFGGGTGTGGVSNTVVNIHPGTVANWVAGGGFSTAGANTQNGKVTGAAKVNFYGGTVAQIYAGGYANKNKTAMANTAHIHIYSASGLTASKFNTGKITNNAAYFHDTTGTFSIPNGFSACSD